MEIRFDLTELDGSDMDEGRLEQLRSSLAIDDIDELFGTLVKLARASIHEYIEMLVGKGMSNRADEAKQDRLFYLIKQVYSPRLPGDDRVSTTFQLTSAQSKTLLRNTLSRYRTRLRDELEATLASIIEGAEDGNEGKFLTPDSEVFVEELNKIVAKQGAHLNPVRKSSVGNRRYFATTDTFVALEDHFDG